MRHAALVLALSVLFFTPPAWSAATKGPGPVQDNNNGASAAQVLQGKTFWSLLSNNWGTQTGSMPNNGALTIVPGALSKPIPLGYHNGQGVVTGDANLSAINIKSGVSIFGVAGAPGIIDTIESSNPAGASDILNGKTAFVNGTRIVGTLSLGGNLPIGSDVVGANGSLVIAIPDGAYSGGHTATAIDTNLVASNVRFGVTLFGVTGSAGGSMATGTALPGDVLRGQTFSNSSASGLTGTRPPAPVAASGQTQSYDGNGNWTSGNGDDGNLRLGVVTSPRFVDHNNGTVTDNLTGLIWLKDSSALGALSWSEALSRCATLASGQLELNDGSRAGQWRLPNIKELQSLLDYGHHSPALPAGYPFTGNLWDYYWSATTDAANTTAANCVQFYNGNVNNYVKGVANFVWPVRGGN